MKHVTIEEGLTLYQTTVKILTLFKLKALADDKFNLDQMAQFFFDKIELLVGKGENAGYQHFLLFPQGLLKAFQSRYPRGVPVFFTI